MACRRAQAGPGSRNGQLDRGSFLRTMLNASHFTLQGTSLPHRACVSLCGSLGSSLACITSPAENAMAQQVLNLSATARTTGAWIGAYQWPVTEGPAEGWGMCSTGETSIAPIWDVGQPDDAVAKGRFYGRGEAWEHCALLSANGLWSDAHCNSGRMCLCETGPVPTVLSAAYLTVADRLHAPPYVYIRMVTCTVSLLVLALLPALALPFIAHRQAIRHSEGEFIKDNAALVEAIRAGAALRLQKSGSAFAIGWFMLIFPITWQLVDMIDGVDWHDIYQTCVGHHSSPFDQILPACACLCLPVPPCASLCLPVPPCASTRPLRSLRCNVGHSRYLPEFWDAFCRSLFPLGLVFSTLCLSPTDEGPIIIFCWVCAVLAFGMTGLMFVTTTFNADVVRFPLAAAIGLPSLFFLASSLRCGVPPRIRLARLWRFTLFLSWAIFAFSAVAVITDASRRWSVILLMPTSFIAGIIALPPIRSRAGRFLGRAGMPHGSNEQKQAGAVVAYLLHGQRAAATLSQALSLFRALPLSELTETMFSRSSFSAQPPEPVLAATSTTVAARRRPGLWSTICTFLSRDGGREHVAKSHENLADARGTAPAVPATFGEVDAFVSHAHCDGALTKFERVSEWGATVNADAMIWLDTVCLDTCAVEESLLCLPCFVSGCRTMLVLASPSYPSRLWCIVMLAGYRTRLTFPLSLDNSRRTPTLCSQIEVFAFLHMRGDARDICVKSLTSDYGSGEGSALAACLANVCTSRAQCQDSTDRHKMLAAIEASFGDLWRFDELMQRVLKKAASSRIVA